MRKLKFSNQFVFFRLIFPFVYWKEEKVFKPVSKTTPFFHLTSEKGLVKTRQFPIWLSEDEKSFVR